jgi:Protein of unknown function (DUF2924)
MTKRQKASSAGEALTAPTPLPSERQALEAVIASLSDLNVMAPRSKPDAVRSRSPGSAPLTTLQSCGRPGIQEPDGLAAEVGELGRLDLAQLRLRWRNNLGETFPAHLPKWLLVRVLAYRMQAIALGGLDAETLRMLRGSSARAGVEPAARFVPRSPKTKDGVSLRPGALLVREWQGRLHRVMIVGEGFAWNGETYSSLSKVAQAITGVRWNGHRFFGLRKAQFGEAVRAGGAPDAE